MRYDLPITGLAVRPLQRSVLPSRTLGELWLGIPVSDFLTNLRN